MEEGETVSTLSRKEQRKQKLMEYLAAKGKLKQPNPKPYLRDDYHAKKPETSTVKVVIGKENKTPAGIVRYEITKVPTLAAQPTVQPTRRVFGVSNKVNVKGSIVAGRQNTSSAYSTSEKSKLHQKSMLTRISTNSIKKQPSSGIQPSGRGSSDEASTAVTKSHSRLSSSSNATWSSSVKTASVRMSLGPIVKTKTGLVPAVTQPRTSQCQKSTHSAATATDTISTTRSVNNRMQSVSVSSVSVSKRSAMVQRKPLPTTTLNNPGDERTSWTARAGIKIQHQNKSSSKSLLGKHSQSPCKGQISSTLKSASSKFTGEPVNLEGKVGLSKTNESSRQATDKSTKLKSEADGKKNSQLCKVASRTSLVPVSRCSSRAASEAVQAAMAELGGKTETREETESKNGHSSANAPSVKTSIRRTGASGTSQTVPQPVRTISRTGQGTVRVHPQTEKKKLTADHEERMRKLQEWREARGISYKRPPMPMKPQIRRTVAVAQPFWVTMKEEDEAHSLICAVDRSLADCIKLLEEGCSPDKVKGVLSRLPAVSHKFAKYWICKARLMEREGNLDVLPMFEEAVGVVLEPVEELRTVVFEILKKKDEIEASEENEGREDQFPAGESTPGSVNNPLMTPQPVRALICGEKGDSCVVKYKITATPGGPPSQQKKPARVNGQEIRFFTPVRRSVRIERASLRYPASLQDHDLCVASYNDLISKEEEEKSEEEKSGETSPSSDSALMYVYRENEALKDKVLVQLVCDDNV